jgi:hypothetical protein
MVAASVVWLLVIKAAHIFVPGFSNTLTCMHYIFSVWRWMNNNYNKIVMIPRGSC